MIDTNSTIIDIFKNGILSTFENPFFRCIYIYVSTIVILFLTSILTQFLINLCFKLKDAPHTLESFKSPIYKLLYTINKISKNLIAYALIPFYGSYKFIKYILTSGILVHTIDKAFLLIKKIFEYIYNIFRVIIEKVVSVFSNIFKAIGKLIKRIFSNFLDMFRWIFDKLKYVLDALWTWIHYFGKNIIYGFASIFKFVKDPLVLLFEKIWEFVKSFFVNLLVIVISISDIFDSILIFFKNVFVIVFNKIVLRLLKCLFNMVKVVFMWIYKNVIISIFNILKNICCIYILTLFVRIYKFMKIILAVLRNILAQTIVYIGKKIKFLWNLFLIWVIFPVRKFLCDNWFVLKLYVYYVYLKMSNISKKVYDCISEKVKILWNFISKIVYDAWSKIDIRKHLWKIWEAMKETLYSVYDAWSKIEIRKHLWEIWEAMKETLYSVYESFPSWKEMNPFK